MLALAKEYAHVGTEELIRGADQKIAIERGHVNRPMRAVFRIDIVVQCSGSLYARPTMAWQSMYDW